MAKKAVSSLVATLVQLCNMVHACADKSWQAELQAADSVRAAELVRMRPRWILFNRAYEFVPGTRKIGLSDAFARKTGGTADFVATVNEAVEAGVLYATRWYKTDTGDFAPGAISARAKDPNASVRRRKSSLPEPTF